MRIYIYIYKPIRGAALAVTENFWAEPQGSNRISNLINQWHPYITFWLSSADTPDYIPPTDSELIAMGDIWSLFSKDDVPKRSVEQDVPKRSVGQEVCDRRKEVMVLFQGQKFLVLGGEGHGKSSLINTFSHVIGLADPNIVYEEVAQVGAGSGSTKTVLLTRYRKEDSMLFHGEKETAPSNFPEFLDTVGMNENNQLQVRIVKLVRALAAGKIKEGADLQDMLKDFNPSFDDMQPDEDMAAWSIIFVGSIVHQPLLDLAKSVGAAADKRTKQGTGE